MDRTCNIWAKRKSISVVIKILSPMCCLPLPRAIYMWKSIKKHVEIVLKLATNGQSDKGFLLTSTFVPKVLSAPALGLYTCIKALKYIPGPSVRWAFTGPLVLCFFFWNSPYTSLSFYKINLFFSFLCAWLSVHPLCFAYGQESEMSSLGFAYC